MDFELKFNALKSEIEREKKYLESLEKEIEKQEKDYTECLFFTDKFLKRCSAHKIKAVCINERNPIVKESITYPFGEKGSVFANGRTKDDVPAIWRVVEEMDISGGCGNTNQHQINELGMSKLIDGVYEYKDGKWNKIQ